MGIREDMEVAFDEMLDGEHPERQALLESALWAAKWAMERCAKEICPHNGIKLRHMFCCEHAQKIRQLAKEME